jgi:alanyl-tRNA synthetase
MKSSEVRQAFIDYFRRHDHQIMASASLVPQNDPSLLFTNAGMVPFKDIFLGREAPAAPRAATVQRVVRAGGKHNDLDNVGYTARHHTFFEMLGNFSFGDYFKREAIGYAWEFLTQELAIPVAKLWVTGHISDQQAQQICLQELSIDPERFTQLDEDNFWSMGDTGPCGPSVEIFYDHGPGVAGGPPGSADQSGDRFTEIWNLVFMQYNRTADGQMTPLPKPSIDTGMGLERISAVMQGVHSNYEIDSFQHLLRAAAELTPCQDLTNPSLRVIADHIRSCAFLLVDGVVPSNEGRGSVLRRIIRRAIRHGHKLGVDKPFFHHLVSSLVAEMGHAYPELVQAQERVTAALLAEEQQFSHTLDQGVKIFHQVADELTGKQIPGNRVFQLYDTYGFPPDLTADMARERGLTIDLAGFEQAMEYQRIGSRQASQFSLDSEVLNTSQATTEFSGYQQLEQTAQVVDIFVAGQSVTSLQTGQSGVVVLNQSPFYGESGGQVGDSGLLQQVGVKFRVEQTTKQGSNLLHHGQLLTGQLKVGDRVEAQVDAERRQAIVLNHSATHLLHAALRQVLGDHVQQQGSLVAPDRLRFDFSHPNALSDQQLATVTELVNQQIRLAVPTVVEEMSMAEAQAKGAQALFGEKYGDWVRVLTIGGHFSIELCGGTHVANSGEIGVFCILSESAIKAGVRRIEAVTGNRALAWLMGADRLVNQLGQHLKANRANLTTKVDQLLATNRQLTKELAQLSQQASSHLGDDLAAQAKEIGGVKLLAQVLPQGDMKNLRELVDQLKNKLGRAVVVLATVQQGKVRLIVGVTKNLTPGVSANELVNELAPKIGGKGGGRADMAQAGGDQPEQLDNALAGVSQWLEAKCLANPASIMVSGT